MKKDQPMTWIFTILSGLILFFILGPIIGMFLSTSGIDIFETAKDQKVVHSIWLTIWTSFAGTVVFAIAAIPFSYLLARKNFFGKQLILGIINLPIVIPHTAAGIALLGFLSRDSIIGQMASKIGLDFVSQPAGIAVAMAFVSIPFLIITAKDGFETVPVKLEKAALNLGASQARVFFTISVPLAWRNIVSGLMLMFARGLSEFGAVVIIAYHPMITPVLIYERFGAFGLKYARPVAVIFIIVSLLVFIIMRIISQRRNNA